MTYLIANKELQDIISTHTPVRVWRVRWRNLLSIAWFQLTHPWGCDCADLYIFFSALSFQLTHPWGCDCKDIIAAYIRLEFQLTHPWGCDIIKDKGYGNPKFQLTHPWGCDWLTHYHITVALVFQLTHPWGCDWIPKRRWKERKDFNSHTREGVTLKALCMIRIWTISTHTPVRVWLVSRKCYCRRKDFNSHTREGVTLMLVAPQYA